MIHINNIHNNVEDILESIYYKSCHFRWLGRSSRLKSAHEPFIARHYELSKSFQWSIALAMIMSVANIRSAIGVMANMNNCETLKIAIV